jgi:ATP-dependent Clp protease ATP-binding subunit ClpA
VGDAVSVNPGLEAHPPSLREPRRFGLPRRSGTGGARFASDSSSGRLDPKRTGKEACSLETSLRQLIVGQDEAIAEIVNIYQMHLTGLSAPQRPVGNFLFLGPTGSGKTRIVEATAEALVGTSRAVVKVDCAEFQHSHEIAKLIGSPPGYLGHRETHPLLSQETLNQYHTDRMKISFLLFDEIEKASDSLWNLLLGILDKATLTLGDNRRVDFSRTLIFMTSNLGASEMSAMLAPRLGFATTTPPDAETDAKIERSGLEAARRKFTPEFMNRLDKVVVFRMLGEPELRRILDIELGMVQQRVFCASPERSFVFSVSPAAKDFMLQAGVDKKYGARHLKRAIERLMVQPISNLIATDQVRGGDLLRVDYDAGHSELNFVREDEGLPIQTMAEMVDAPVRLWMKAAGATAADAPKAQATRNQRR